MAPSSYITNAAAFATADFLRRVTIVAYRTRELQLAFPASGIGSRERERFEREPGWQQARRAVEQALVAYDWGEAFTALNLVLVPAVKEAARAAGDELGWLLATFLQEDADRRARWSRALAAYAVERNPENEAVLARWIERWAPAADEAAAGLASLL
jgi:toluene monooxygenase system protein E